MHGICEYADKAVKGELACVLLQAIHTTYEVGEIVYVGGFMLRTTCWVVALLPLLRWRGLGETRRKQPQVSAIYSGDNRGRVWNDDLLAEKVHIQRQDWFAGVCLGVMLMVTPFAIVAVT